MADGSGIGKNVNKPEPLTLEKLRAAYAAATTGTDPVEAEDILLAVVHNNEFTRDPADLGSSTVCDQCHATVQTGDIYIPHRYENRALCPACYEDRERRGLARVKRG